MKKQSSLNHIKAYREYIKKPKLGRTECEGILGTNDAVARFSQFYERNADSLNIIGEYLMHDFIMSNDVSSAEAKIYKKAIGKFGEFFIKCANEIAIQKQLLSKENK